MIKFNSLEICKSYSINKMIKEDRDLIEFGKPSDPMKQ